MFDNGTQAQNGQRRHMPSPLIFSPDSMPPPALPALSMGPAAGTTTAGSSTTGGLRMPFVKNHVTRRLKAAKTECDKELQRITNNITAFFESRALRDNDGQVESDGNRPIGSLHRRQSLATQEPDVLRDAFAVDALRSVLQIDDNGSDPGYEAESENMAHSQHDSNPSPILSPITLRRNNSSPWDKPIPPSASANVNVPISSRASLGGGSESGSLKLSSYAASPPSAGASAWPVHAPSARRLSRTVHRPVSRKGNVSGQSSRSTSRSRSPLPRPPKLNSSVSSSHRRSRVFVDDLLDPSLAALYELISVATDVLESSTSQITQPKVCEQFVQRVQTIGRAWDENPEWQGRNWYVQVLLAVASLSRVVEWWEAEKQFWNFDDNDDAEDEPLTFVMKASEDSVDTRTTSPYAPQEPSEEENHTSAAGEHDERQDPTEDKLSQTASIGRKSRDVMPKDLSGSANVDLAETQHDASKLAESQRILATERLKLQVETAQNQNIVMELSLDGDHVVWVNYAWRVVVGTDPEELGGTRISRSLAPDSAEVFHTATQLLLQDDSHTVEVSFQLLVNPSGDQGRSKGEYLQMEGKGMLMFDREDGQPSHTMWVVRPIPDFRIDKLPATSEEVSATTAPPKTPSRSLTSRSALEPATPLPFPLPINSTPILCRICECQIPQWYFEKHSETCVETHRLEAEIADCNDSIQELRNTIRGLSAAVDRASPAMVPEYRGMPIFSPSSSPTTSSPLSLFRSNKMQRMNVKKVQKRFLEHLEDILSIAAEVSIPSLKDEEAQEPIERQRLLSPTSERKMSQIRTWVKPISEDPALAQVAGDAERIMRQKLDHVVRMQNTIRYSEKIWQEWQEQVTEHLDDSFYQDLEDDSGAEGSSEDAPHSADEILTAPASSCIALNMVMVVQQDDGVLSSQQTPLASSSPVPCSPMPLESTSTISRTKPLDRLNDMPPPPVPKSAFSPSISAAGISLSTSGSLASTLSATSSLPKISPSGPPLTSLTSGTTLPSSHPSLAMPMAAPVSASWQTTGKLSRGPTRSSTPSSVSSPLALAAPIVAAEDLVPPISLGDSSKSTHLTVGTRPSNASLLDPNSNLTPPGSPVVSSREGASSRRGHRRLSTAANIVLSQGGTASSNSAPRAPSVAPISRTQPTTIKDFEIIKPISKGAFGSVFLAKKRTTGDYFAIKVLKKADMIAKNQITNVKAERMILMNQSDSPYVAKLYFTFQSKENLYLVMEYLNGGDCAALIKSLGSLPEEWTKNYIAEVVLGLEFLHQRGVVHRDLKPDNLLIDHQGHLKLTDFGLSRTGLLGRQTRETLAPLNPRSRYQSRSRPPSVDSSGFLSSPLLFSDNYDDVSESSGSESIYGAISRRSVTKKSESPMQSFATELTNDLRSHSNDLRSRSGLSTPPGTQKFVGTPDYLAPETILGMRGDDAAVDWWALGVVTYEFLYGIPPFHAETPEKVFENILSGRVEWHEEWIDFSEDALEFMRALLDIDPITRLGAKGTEEIKAHPFFKGIDWNNVTKNTAAFIPQVKDPESTDYFDPRGAVAQHFHDDDDAAASVANSESPGSLFNPLTGGSSSVAVPHQSLGGREAPDDFGSFSFKNLPVLKQANDDMIKKMKSDQFIPMAHAYSESGMGHSRRRSVSHRMKKGLPNVITSVSNPDQQKLMNPPSPTTSTSSVASSPSRASMAQSTPGSAAHSRKPSEFGAVERFKLNHLDGVERRNTMPSRLRTASVSTSSGGDGSGSDQWQSSGGHASPQLDFGTPPSSVHSADLRKGDNADRALTCLLAEDNPITAKMIETLLIRLGCRVVVVSDGSEAISVAMGDIKFDCILMDLHMPVLDGEGAARYIKSTNSKNTHTPIISVSAYGALDGEAAGLFVACLPKPLQKAELLPVMTKLGFRVGSNPGAATRLTTRASVVTIPAM